MLLPAEDSQAELLDLLSNILKAIHFDLQSEASVIEAPPGTALSLASLIRTHKPRHVLLFGIPAEQVGIRFHLAPYFPVQHQGITYLAADSLQRLQEERLQGGKTLRASLWTALREIFPQT